MRLAKLLDRHLLVDCRTFPATNDPSNTNSSHRRAPLQAMIALGLAVFGALSAAPESRAQAQNAPPRHRRPRRHCTIGVCK
jgi:hypothetical protein